jgi:hypothetical protein
VLTSLLRHQRAVGGWGGISTQIETAYAALALHTPRSRSRGAGEVQPVIARGAAYLFKTLDARLGKDATGKDRAMAQAVHTYFANFAKTGDPNGAGLPTWPKYDPARSDLMNFTLDDGPVMEADPWKERLDLVERAIEKQTPSQASSKSRSNL